MKRITLVLLTLAAATFGTKVSAQGKYGADSAECIKYLIIRSITSRRTTPRLSLTGERPSNSVLLPQARTCCLTV